MTEIRTLEEVVPELEETISDLEEKLLEKDEEIAALRRVVVQMAIKIYGDM